MSNNNIAKSPEALPPRHARLAELMAAGACALEASMVDGSGDLGKTAIALPA